MTFRLGYLVPEFPGQTHAFFWREVKALEKLGCEVVILSTRAPKPGLICHTWAEEAIQRTEYLLPFRKADYLHAAYELPLRAGIEAANVKNLRLMRDVILSCLLAARLRRLTSERRIDHVHVHSCGRSALIAALARRSGGCPYSLTLHNPLSVHGPGQRFKWRYAQFATIVSAGFEKEVKSFLRKLAPSQIYTQPMGVDAEYFKRSKSYIPFNNNDELRIFSCGRLNSSKGHEILIRAVASIIKKGIQASLEIAGEDDIGGMGYRRKLESIISNIGLEGSVKLLGAVSEVQVRQRLESAHVFVLASRVGEGVPVALMESMSLQVPTIGSDVGGVRELISDRQNGLVVRPNRVDDVEAAIMALIEDPDLAQRLSAAGRQTVLDGFTANRGAETLLRGIAENMPPRQRARISGNVCFGPPE